MIKNTSKKEENEIPKSALTITDEKKVEILIAMMHDVRNSIESWSNRSFQAVSWSGGILLAFIGYWITNDKDLTFNYRIIIAIGICLYGVLMQIYLLRVKFAHKGNGELLSKIEAALNLHKPDEFIKCEPFLVYSKKWIQPKSHKILQVTNLLIIVFAVFVAIFL
jgi:hypothetical protein